MEKVKMPKVTNGYIISMTGIVLWSTTPIFIGHLVTNHHMPALLLSFWRNILVCAISAPVLYLIRRALLRVRPDEVWFYIWFGLVLSLFNSIWILSVKVNGAAVATVLAYSSAGFTAVLAWKFFDEKLGAHKITAVILSLTGCILVTEAYRPEVWALNPWGIATGILSGVSFAGYNLIGKAASKRNINPWTSMFYSFAFGGFFTLLYNLMPMIPGAAGSPADLFPHLPVNGWIVFLVLSIPTVLGFGLYVMSMNYLPVSIVSLLATLEPVLTAVLAYILLGERMTPIQIVGSLTILSAVVIVQFERR
jgi:drug/metabolite transporter (DMT)-like permease